MPESLEDFDTYIQTHEQVLEDMVSVLQCDPDIKARAKNDLHPDAGVPFAFPPLRVTLSEIAALGQQDPKKLEATIREEEDEARRKAEGILLTEARKRADTIRQARESIRMDSARKHLEEYLKDGNSSTSDVNESALPWKSEPFRESPIKSKSAEELRMKAEAKSPEAELVAEQRRSEEERLAKEREETERLEQIRLQAIRLETERRQAAEAERLAAIEALRLESERIAADLLGIDQLTSEDEDEDENDEDETDVKIDPEEIACKLDALCPAVNYTEFIDTLKSKNVDLGRFHEIPAEGGYVHSDPDADIQRTSENDFQEGCTVCLCDVSEANDGSSLVRMLPCRHVFHDQCIMHWLKANHSNCPTCMQDIPGF